MRNHLKSKKRLGAAISVSVAAVFVVGGATISIAADDSDDGRDPGARPEAPAQPVADEVPVADQPGEVDGRPAPGERPLETRQQSAGPLLERSTAADSAAAADDASVNGRGGADPSPPVAAGVSDAKIVAGGDIGSNDSDTGTPPAKSPRDRGRMVLDAPSDRGLIVLDAAPSVPTDQDVPGAPTGVVEPAGALPGEAGSDDRDG